MLPAFCFASLNAKQQKKTTSANKVAFDSTNVIIRMPADDVLKPYLSDDEFAYDRTPQPPVSTWERIWYWIISKIFRVISNPNAALFWRILPYLLFGASLLYVILKLTKTDIRGLFYDFKNQEQIQFEEIHDNIYGMQFDQLLAEALKDKNFRVAIRLYYLKTLKALSEKKMIQWRPEKTNRQYVSELPENGLKQPFRDITTLFEWIWYGNFPVDINLYKSANSQFEKFHRQLAQK